jgi:hypothetical protein
MTAGTGDFRGAIAPWLYVPVRAKAAATITVEMNRIENPSRDNRTANAFIE